MDYVKQLIVPAITALVVVLLVLWYNAATHPSSFRTGAASPVGTSPAGTVLAGGSQPTVYNALEATESFISDGPTYLGSSTSSPIRTLTYNKCNITQLTPGSFGASTTQQFICAATGVVAGEKIFGDLPEGAGVNADGSGSGWGGFVLVATYATTSNQVGFTLANDTGAATSSFPAATTSVEYWAMQ